MQMQDPGTIGAAPPGARDAGLDSYRQALAALPDLGDPYADERAAIERLLARAPAAPIRAAGAARALRYIGAVRGAEASWLSAQSLLSSFPLASAEGVALLRLAEALLRAPDAETQTWLIAEKLAAFRAAQASGDGLVQRVLSTALKIAGHTSSDAELSAGANATSLRAWLSRTALRPLVIDGIRRFGEQFVFAPDLGTAIARAARRPNARELYSFDMLGEGARTAADARRNFDAYAAAIAALGQAPQTGSWQQRDGISIKLSAIHPRFETLQLDRVHAELYPALLELARAAAAADINFAIDAEESERLALQIALLERLMAEPSLAGWEGLGLALQTYLPRALATVDHIVAQARALKRPLAVRLVKGAYWDAEIKRAQELGMPGFPVFTCKWATDMAYVVLAERLFAADAPIYAQFATHNALTVGTLIELARAYPDRRYEFQRLHGMSAPLYDALLAEEPQARVRVYAPVGEFRDLLAYLVRRLLENGANTSFVHQISDPSVAPTALVEDPFDRARRALDQGEPLPALRTGHRLFDDRANSRGIDVQHAGTLLRHLDRADAPPPAGSGTEIRNPARISEVVGRVQEASADGAQAAVARAAAAYRDWSARGMADRAALLDEAAARLDAEHDALVALLQREAGKTLLDAHLEVREAIDFLRYYAQQARALDGETALPGPAGESNRLRVAGRGVFVCISPWNFPLAIFIGQVAAALVTGNSVIAKPAEQTPLIAQRAVQLLHAAGVPDDVLQFAPGRGETVGAALTSDPRIAGVAFTGSTATARAINRALAARDAPIGVLIAETGGQNAMIVDSTALPEQVTDAVMASAFRSCGQRCSALRVLLLQKEIADSMLEMIAGAMRELRIGDPADPRTDVGPVIDAEQLALLTAHRDWLRANGRRIHECELPPGLAEQGHFFAPVAYEIASLDVLTREHFGPILHVVRFDKNRFDAVLDTINATGYGLTCGLHTRLDARVEQVAARVRAGNLYVNRNMIGAVVGVQPFGGEGLSGTGPKAGGPHYLLRFVTERTVTVNTTAAGGNVELLA
jgi:RHH-type proline utilization regulon transcriptional repressor/proline dehydrogenase/delta 1-pyrroline-5-carboxylate dehydrogenase